MTRARRKGAAVAPIPSSRPEEDKRADELDINVRALLIAKEALEAAAPHMRAAAWEEGMQAMYDTTSSEWPPIPERNPYRPTA